MADTFFFYDLETSGISPRGDRIMQFAGQHCDENFQPVGKLINQLIKLSPDILPQPEAILLTGIMPADCAAKGISEAEFADLFNQQIAKPHTIFVGYNNLRFDDEFIRFLNYRNFYDAYEWHWRGGNSRWDLLDLVRMTRALRPDGLKWPFAEDNKPTNRLELLTSANDLSHSDAHDAASDVLATIELAKLISSKQPTIFNYSLNMRKKDEVIALVDSRLPYVYTSSHFSSEFLHTTVVTTLSIDPHHSSALVYDLRQDPKQFLDLSVDELVERWRYDPEAVSPRLPIKTMKFNRCPAVAPLSVLNIDCQKRLDLDLDIIKANLEVINNAKDEFNKKLTQVVKSLDSQRQERQQAPEFKQLTAEQRLYDKFLSKSDQAKFPKARSQAASSSSKQLDFEDDRLTELYLLYKARNFPGSLDQTETKDWHNYVKQKLFTKVTGSSAWEQYKARLNELKQLHKSEPAKLKTLKALDQWAKTIADDYAAD